MTSLLFFKNCLVSNDSIYSQNCLYEILSQKMIPRNSKIAFVVKIVQKRNFLYVADLFDLQNIIILAWNMKN